MNLLLPLSRIIYKVRPRVMISNVVKFPFRLLFLNPEWKTNELLYHSVVLQIDLKRIHSVL
jgi:hypothetical protein